MTTSRRLLLILAILVSCVGCDQTTKSVAKTCLSQTEVVSMLGDSVRLQIANNYGAFLSLGASLPPALRSGLLSIGVGAVLLGLLIYGIAVARANPLVVPAIALVVGGGLSNLLDRLRYGGYVVDFINLGIGNLRTGIFNVADVCIMGGVVMLLFSEQIYRLLGHRDD
jgi:signal peptidase II